MGLFSWLLGKKNAPAANIRPAVNMMVAAPPAQSGGRKRTRKVQKGRKGRKTTRRVQRGGCTSACWEPRLRRCVC